MKLLVAFDFDQTIIHFNSDTMVGELIPKDAVSTELDELKESPLWLDYMQGIFRLLQKSNVTKDDILNVCASCQSIEGMIDLIKNLKSSLKADVIIISDSNTVFIEHWLKCRNIYDLIDKIYTNPGEFNSDGLLEVKMYHEQDWCPLSTKNLCKGYVLEKHVETELGKNNVYDVIAYVGDGRNDLCPLLKLKKTDFCFPRINYSLHRILNENEEMKSKIEASIHPWNRGLDIYNVLKAACA